MKKKEVVFVSVIFVLTLILGIVTLEGETNQRVSFEKVLEFSDDSEDFYFKYPDNPYKRQIQVDKEGNIYILDADRVLKFNSSGTFIKNLVSEGQGPGEVNNLKNFFVHENKISIYNHYPDKIIEKDSDGVLKKEFRINHSLNRFFAVYGKNFYSFDYDMPVLKGENAKIIDIDWMLTRVFSKGKIEKIKDCKFPIKTFIATNDGNIGEIRLMKISVARLKDNRFFVTHSTEYEIKLLDIKKAVVIKTFRREYERQDTPEEIAKKRGCERFQLGDRIYRRPPQKYLNDIGQLLVYKNNLWVVTSTVDEKKGVLVDVYNRDCQFTGSFYLKLSDRLSYLDYFSFHAYVFGEFLYKIERDKEDNPWIVKYKITTG